MKKTLSFLGLFILLILAAMLILPYFYKDKLKEMAQNEINKQLDAEVSFEDINLSFFKHFPKLSLGIDELCIKGKQHFAHDTLTYVQHLSLSLNPWLLLQNEVAIKGIYVSQAKVRALVAYSGQANWDIMATDTSATSTAEAVETTESSFAIALENIHIEAADILYADSSMQLFTHLQQTDIQLRGKLMGSLSTLQLQLHSPALSVAMNGVPYIHKRKLAYQAEIESNTDKMRFMLRDNEMKLQALVMQWQGFVQMNTDDSYDVDLKFSSPNNSVSEAISLIPLDYQASIQDVQSSGLFQLSGYAKGHYHEEAYPSFGFFMQLKDARIQYPNMPLPIEHLNVELQAENKSNNLDHTIIKAPHIQWQIADNTFDAHFMSKTPLSDPYVEMGAQGTIDFKELQQAFPIPKVRMQGELSMDFEAKAKQSDIETEAYDRIAAQGKLSLKQIAYYDEDSQRNVKIAKGAIHLSPNKLIINQMQMYVDSSDFLLQGQLDNMLSYYFKQATLRGHFSLHSALIDANALVGEEAQSSSPQQNEAQEESTAGHSIQIPHNLDLLFETKINQMLYQQLSIDKIEGKLHLHDGKAELQPLRMQVADGQINCQGSYQAIDSSLAQTAMQLNIKQMDVTKAAQAFVTVKKLFPIAKNTSGKIDIDMQLNSKIDGSMAPVLSSVNAKGHLQSGNIGIKDGQLTQSLAKLLLPKSNGLNLRNINASFEIVKGEIEVKSQDFMIDKYPARFGGTQSLDKHLDYALSMDIPSKALGADMLGGLAQQLKIADVITAKLKIQGSLSKPKFGLGFGANGNSLQTEAKKKALALAQAEAHKLLSEAKAKGDALVAAAKKQAAQLKAEADKQAAQLKANADKEVDALVKQAGSNPIAQAAAKAAGNKLKDKANSKIDSLHATAKNKAEQVVKEAEKKNEALQTAAKQKGDALIQKAEKSS